MKFKFPLETVLKHRKRLEEMAQREFAEAQANVDAVLRSLEEMYRRMDEVREEILGLQKSGDPDRIEKICQMEGFLTGHKIRIEMKRQEARKLLVIVEEKQELLILAAKERKVMVKLKEKRQNEYREWLNYTEAQLADDQTSMTRARLRLAK